MASKFGGYREQEFLVELYELGYEVRGPMNIEFLTSYSKKANSRTIA
jgi:hypothetical protein